MARARKKKTEPAGEGVADAVVADEVEEDVDEFAGGDAEPAEGEDVLEGEDSEFEESDDNFEDDAAPDLDEEISKNGAGSLAVRREIERRMEEKRLAKDIDDLDFDLD